MNWQFCLAYAKLRSWRFYVRGVSKTKYNISMIPKYKKKQNKIKWKSRFENYLICSGWSVERSIHGGHRTSSMNPSSV